MRRGGGFIPTKVLTFRFVMDSFGRQIRATGLHDGLSLNLTLTYKHTTSIIVFFSSLSCFRCCYIVLLLLLLGTACYFVGWRFSLLTAFGIPPPFATKFLPRDLAPPHLFSSVLYRQLEKGGV
jgi:hypothetical protein